MRSALLTLVGLIPAPHVSGQQPVETGPALATATIAGIETTIRGAMAKKHIPGLSVAVGLDGRVVWSKGYGMADVENQVPATAETSYRLASISKPITAVAALQLAEAGTLSLDAPIRTYVAEFPEKRWPVTARQLLSHLGGIRHYRGSEVFSTRHYGTVRAGLRIFADDPLVHEPGTGFRYTSYGYNLLGAAVASAAGRPFVALLQQKIFDPAGMAGAQVDSIRTIIPHRAQGYTRNVLGVLQNSRIVDTSNKIPAGGLCATVGDLVHFGQALFDGRLLPKATCDRMWTSAKTRDGKAVGYGLGFKIYKSTKPRIVGHSGGQPRVNTMWILRPDEAIVVALFCNLERAGVTKLTRQISDLVAAQAKTR